LGLSTDSMIKPAMVLMIVIISGAISVVFLGPGLTGQHTSSSTTVTPEVGSATTSGTTTSLTATTETSSYGGGPSGRLAAQVTVGPTQPVCYVNSTEGPAPAYYSAILLVITDSSGNELFVHLNWISNGCDVVGSSTTTLVPGSYSLNLSSCTFVGCKTALPRSFVIIASQTTTVDVSIFTGIA
jgi:hypothetical protein